MDFVETVSLLFLISVGLIVVWFIGALIFSSKTIEPTTQHCPKCKKASEFYRQPLSTYTGGMRGGYTENFEVNFCGDCDIEVLPRVTFNPSS
jgi:hypothetical protein